MRNSGRLFFHLRLEVPIFVLLFSFCDRFHKELFEIAVIAAAADFAYRTFGNAPPTVQNNLIYSTPLLSSFPVMRTARRCYQKIRAAFSALIAHPNRARVPRHLEISGAPMGAMDVHCTLPVSGTTRQFLCFKGSIDANIDAK